MANSWDGAILLVLCLSAISSLQAKDTPSDVSKSLILFLDNKQGSYLQSSPAEAIVHSSPLASVASIAALLGVDLPPGVDSTTSDQLASLLTPSPFVRPGNVFTVFVPGMDSSVLSGGALSALRSISPIVVRGLTTEHGKPVRNAKDALVASTSLVHHMTDMPTFSGQDFTFVPLSNCNPGGSLEAWSDLIGWVVEGSVISQKADKTMKVDLAKPNVNSLVEELICLLTMAEQQGEISGQVASPKLLFASIANLKAVLESLNELDSLAVNAMVLDAIAKTTSVLQDKHNGELTTTIALLGDSHEAVSSNTFHKAMDNSRSIRVLQETALDPVVVATALLVTRVVVGSTVVLLLIATLLGIGALFGMPITKDTLLYSGVKFD